MLARTVKSLSSKGVLFVIALVFLCASPATALPSEPTNVIRAGTDKALEILKSRPKGQRSLRARHDEILDVVANYFDFDEMAKRALGRPWKEQSRNKQQEFVRLFKDLIFNTYVDKVENLTVGDERVFYDEERVEGDFAQVKTRIVGGGNPGVAVEYRLYSQNGEWMVYDVVVEGISLVNNYRQQFNSILASTSFDSLLGRMRQKVAMQSGM